jgi:hypothetical protein
MRKSQVHQGLSRVVSGVLGSLLGAEQKSVSFMLCEKDVRWLGCSAFLHILRRRHGPHKELVCIQLSHAC